jgi:hypothetical protein
MASATIHIYVEYSILRTKPIFYIFSNYRSSGRSVILFDCENRMKDRSSGKPRTRAQTSIRGEPDVGAALGQLPLSLRVFGRLPGTGVEGCTEAGVRKASREETAGGVCAGGGVSLWDLMRMFGLISQCRTGTTAEQVL